MLAIIFAPFFIAIQVLLMYRSVKHIRPYATKWTMLLVWLFAILFFGGVFVVVLGFTMPAIFPAKRFLTRMGFYWFGFVLYLFVGLLICLLVRHTYWLITKGKNYSKSKARQISIAFIIVFTTIMCIYGIYNAHDLKVKNYDVKIDKNCELDDLNVVLLADLHIGYNVGLTEMQDMVDKVNGINPDVIIIAGDIFDNEYEAIEEPDHMIKILSSMKSKYGTYVTYGNHDIEEKILMGFTFNWFKKDSTPVQADVRMNDFIDKCGFTLLYDDYIKIEDSIYIYGRPDASKINLGNTERKDPTEVTQDLDKTCPIIVIDHQPSELQELADAGVDLDLCGHTHKGQVWPGTLTIDLFWDNAYGLMTVDNMTNIVTSGVGLFGPNMRTDSNAEICNINITFK